MDLNILPLSPQKFLVLIESNSERWKTELTLEPPVVFNLGPWSGNLAP